MIIFSSTKLERAIADGVLTSWQKAKYLFFILILYPSSGPIYVLTPSFGPKPPVGHGLATFISSILIILFTYYGVKKCYGTNREIDDTDFLGRFTALYMPLTFKFMAFFLPIMIIAAFLASSRFFDKETGKNLFMYFLKITGPAATYLFYLFLNRSFKRLGILINQTKRIPNNAIETDRE